MAKSKEASRPSPLSQERVQDSSDENESQSAESESESGSTQASSSDEEDKGPPKVNGQDDSDTESTLSPVVRQKRPSPGVTQSSRKKAKTNSQTVQIAAKPYKAPSGYEPLTMTASDYAADTATLFDNLTGKQIWHISVPDTVTIDSIKELDIQAVLKGEPIVSKNGVDYNMQPVPPRNETVLLPQGTKSTYKQCPTKIERSFHLREMIKKSKSQEEAPVVFTATATGKPKVVRKQPEGLKMRYTPYGATPIQEDAEDVEMDDVFHVPSEVLEPSPKKKSKKSKETIQDSSSGRTPEPTTLVPDSQTSIEKKKKKKRRLVDANVL
ncbi:DNA-directed RNA polymerase I subunit RPA34.5-domain-containing protein [Exophiala viscosa]|uniref:DNA-directed RNA polymerase I subunit RPA34.5-domain-containing protein n=1 Tax=Exophiala viscosa TaxID=2486360 RepID=UPI00218EF1FF|nr:DNA-directed RNA polymerase I subunit RPA34.5-domain-containing protein [Exophiala viscosa]